MIEYTNLDVRYSRSGEVHTFWLRNDAVTRFVRGVTEADPEGFQWISEHCLHAQGEHGASLAMAIALQGYTI